MLIEKIFLMFACSHILMVFYDILYKNFKEIEYEKKMQIVKKLIFKKFLLKKEK